MNRFVSVSTANHFSVQNYYYSTRTCPFFVESSLCIRGVFVIFVALYLANPLFSSFSSRLLE